MNKMTKLDEKMNATVTMDAAELRAGLRLLEPVRLAKMDAAADEVLECYRVLKRVARI